MDIFTGILLSNIDFKPLRALLPPHSCNASANSFFPGGLRPLLNTARFIQYRRRKQVFKKTPGYLDLSFNDDGCENESKKNLLIKITIPPPTTTTQYQNNFHLYSKFFV